MTRCRRTDAIAEVLADPSRGADVLTDGQRAHVEICAECHAIITGLGRLDAALTAGMRSLAREDLPIAALATPAVPRTDPATFRPAAMLAAAAVIVLAVSLVVAGGGMIDRLVGVGPTPDGSVGPSDSPAASPPDQESPVPSSAPSEAPAVTPAPSMAPPLAELSVGEVAAVVDEPLVVRTAPGTEPDSTITEDRLWIGQRVRIHDGPVEADGYTWWEVQVGEIRGWVADAERDESAPWLSPIGSGQIAYADHMSSADMEIRTIGPEGGEPSVLLDVDASAGMRLVLSCGGGVTPAEWTHDGARLAFDYAIGGCDRTVGYVGADGSEVVTVGPGSWPAWRPDGTALTWAPNVPYQPCGANCGGEVDSGPWELMHLEIGGEPFPLTDSPDWSSASTPAWSPDRRTIAYSRWEPSGDPEDLGGGIGTIYVATSDGSDARLLTDGQIPVWSPDGRWIYFGRHNDATGASESYRIRPDGTDLAALGEAWQALPSPDGTRVAIVREGGLFTMAPDGTDYALAIPGTTVDGFDWSPDGRQLVASIDYAGNAGLYRVSLAGLAPAITGLVANGSNPRWQPMLLDPRLVDAR